MEAQIAFGQECLAMGLLIAGLPIMDGTIHRVPLIAKRSGKDGAYIGYLDGRPSGYVQNFVTGSAIRWKFNGGSSYCPISHEEIERQQQEREAERQAEYDAAAKMARSLWDKSSPADPAFPYLVAKGIRAHGVRQFRNALVVPCVDRHGVMRSAQYIYAGGGKLFLKGGQTAGCRYRIGAVKDVVFIAEGFATAATVHEATGHCCMVAYNAGNLAPVALAVREKYPWIRIVIAGDDDRGGEKNTGREKAVAAARAVRGRVVFPSFADGEVGTDWNDYRGDDVASLLMADVPVVEPDAESRRRAVSTLKRSAAEIMRATSGHMIVLRSQARYMARFIEGGDLTRDEVVGTLAYAMGKNGQNIMETLGRYL